MFMSTKPIPDARTTAYRTFCLGALHKRYELEQAASRLKHSDTPDNVRRFVLARHWTENQRLLRWIYDEKLEPHFTRSERSLLAQSFPGWPDTLLEDMRWRTERLGTLLWALRVIDTMPGFDTPFKPDALMAPLDIFTPTIDFVWQAALRSSGEVRSMRDLADLWHWRTQLAELAQLGIRPQGDVSFAEIIRETAEQAYQDRYLPAPIANDFPAFGRAYGDLTNEQQQIVARVTQERSAALDWLCAGIGEGRPVAR
jgi:hypothetical protein